LLLSFDAYQVRESFYSNIYDTAHMTPERWRQVNQLFTAVVELAPEERNAF
jgi:hypothetical protein